jgi:hypothetical protein
LLSLVLLACILSHASKQAVGEEKGRNVVHLFVEFCRNRKDSHAHNTERNEKLFEKETNKTEEELSDPSLS